MTIKSAVLLGVWILMVLVALHQFTTFKKTAGPAGASVGRSWPSETQLVRSEVGRSALVVFLHPRCSCSLATLTELKKIMLKLKDRVDVSLVVYKPKGKPMQWVEGKVLAMASELPRHRLIIDEDGAETKIFGAMTSGQIVLFDTTGVLVFAGGITPLRGHIGDSVGRQAILRHFESSSGILEAKVESPVYGCTLGVTL